MSPIIVPGTPDSFIATESLSKDEKEAEEHDSDDSRNLLQNIPAYRQQYTPDIDESNAESADRTELINREIALLKCLRKQCMHQKQASNNDGFTTPEKHIQNTLNNNMQSIGLTSDEATPLSNNPQCIESIKVIMDTGDALTMFPETYRFAWRNLRPCLYALSGCFI